ncbi:MAG: DEAD/DEAH box helicase [Streptosporangiales bacterium]|nr:DEAD/DEAH box helicase [Streptosporangiales bacterium]
MPPNRAAAEPSESRQSLGRFALTSDAAVAVPSFDALGLPKPLVNALARSGITEPFPIQDACIPDVLTGRDVLGRGQTGSGKTLAFGLPLMTRIAGFPAAPKRPRALIVVPTRELAMQVSDALEPLGRGLDLRTKIVVGGTSMGRQIQALRRGVEIIVATPGRLHDLIRQGECELGDVEVTVLDEADHMCDLGFLPEVTALLEMVPEHGQRLLFSATLDKDVDSLVKRFLHDPVTHSVSPETASVDTMEHRLLLVPPRDKTVITDHIARGAERAILFARTKQAVDRITERLAAAGVAAGGLHGGKTQRVRTRTLAEFREGVIRVLVATDVAARGIHVDGVTLVVHLDPPNDSKDYLHRAGRTARAGASGIVVTLALPHQARQTERMLQRAGVKAQTVRVHAAHAELVRLFGAADAEPLAPAARPVRRRDYDDRPRGRRRGGDRWGDRPRRGGPSGGPRRPYRRDRDHDRPAGGHGRSADHHR